MLLSTAGSGVGLTGVLLLTVKRIIWPTVCGSGGVPAGNGAFAVFLIVIWVPAGIDEKSTSMSALWPGAIKSEVIVAGALRYPPSVPIWVKGTNTSFLPTW